MDFNKFKGNNNFLIWILVIVVAVGFGKCGESLGMLCAPNRDCDDHHSKKHYKDGYCYNKPVPVPNYGMGSLGNLFGGGLLNNNLLFIVIVVALLFLCKDNKNEECGTSSIEYDEETLQE